MGPVILSFVERLSSLWRSNTGFKWVLEGVVIKGKEGCGHASCYGHHGVVFMEYE